MLQVRMKLVGALNHLTRVLVLFSRPVYHPKHRQGLAGQGAGLTSSSRLCGASPESVRRRSATAAALRVQHARANPAGFFGATNPEDPAAAR